jgi:hypothetical protein
MRSNILGGGYDRDDWHEKKSSANRITKNIDDGYRFHMKAKEIESDSCHEPCN